MTDNLQELTERLNSKETDALDVLYRGDARFISMVEEDYSRPKRILIIDDDATYAEIVSHMLEHLGEKLWTLEVETNPQTALPRLASGASDLYILDIKMPQLDGLDVLKFARDHGVREPVIMLTGYVQKDFQDRAMKLGAAAFLDKHDLDKLSLDRTVRYCLWRASLIKIYAALQKELGKALTST